MSYSYALHPLLGLVMTNRQPDEPIEANTVATKGWTHEYTSLFCLYLLTWGLGNGIVPLLPVRSIVLGISQTNSGIFLASIYFFLVVGSLCSSTLLKMAGSPRTLLLWSSVLRCIALPLMAATQLTMFILASIVCWFCFGAELCALKVQANLAVSPKQLILIY